MSRVISPARHELARERRIAQRERDMARREQRVRKTVETGRVYK